MLRLILGLALFVQVAYSAIAFVAASTVVQASGNPSSGTSSGITTTGATLLVITVTDVNVVSNNDTVSDSKGNTWHHLATDYANANLHATIFYAYDHGGSALSVGSSHTFTVAGAFTTFSAQSFSGTDTTSAVFTNEIGANTASALSLATGSFTCTYASSLIMTTGGFRTPTTPYTVSGTGTFSTPITGNFSTGTFGGNGGAYSIQSGGPTAENVTWTANAGTGQIVSIAACFAPPIAAATGSKYGAIIE